MNKILCNKAEFCFLHEVDIIYPGTIKLKRGYQFHEIKLREIELTTSVKQSDPGTLKTTTVKIKTTDDCSILTKNPTANIILSLTTSENDKIIVGDTCYPAIFTYQEKIPTFEFTFTANSTK